MVDLWDEGKPTAKPNPKYKKAAKIAKQFDLHWYSLVEDFGCWRKRLIVKNNDEVYYYDVQFTEAQLETSYSPELLVKATFKDAVFKLAQLSGLSRKDVALKVITVVKE